MSFEISLNDERKMIYKKIRYLGNTAFLNDFYKNKPQIEPFTPIFPIK